MEDNAAYGQFLHFFGAKEHGDGAVFRTVVERVGSIVIYLHRTSLFAVEGVSKRLCVVLILATAPQRSIHFSSRIGKERQIVGAIEFSNGHLTHPLGAGEFYGGVFFAGNCQQ